MSTIFVVATADTKAQELSFLRDRLVGHGHTVTSVDVGTRAPAVATDVSAADVAAHHWDGAKAVLRGDDRGQAVAAMGDAFAAYCRAERKNIDAIIGIGGGGGTSIICAGLHALDYGVPKIMVSTLASGDVGPYVGISDIVMIPSVTDLAGLNRLSRHILHNAAQALLGMAASPYVAQSDLRPSVGLSMFGVTTPSVTQVVQALDEVYDCMVFHATGTGGRVMERLLVNDMLEGLIDLTTTEIADEVVGGLLSAGPDRLDAVVQTGKPYVGSVGALDMVNFWAPDTVPPKFSARLFYNHNPNVTLMRTTAEECVSIGRFIATKLNACAGPVRILIPEKGVSALDIKGGPFWDPEADNALFATLLKDVEQTPNRQIIKLPFHINDPEFSAAAVEHFQDII